MAFDLAVCYWNYFREASVERLGLIVLVLDRPRSSESPLLNDCKNLFHHHRREWMFHSGDSPSRSSFPLSLSSLVTTHSRYDLCSMTFS